MKPITIFFTMLFTVSACIIFAKTKSHLKAKVNVAKHSANHIDKNSAVIKKVKSHATFLKSFALKNNFSDKNCFLIDMKIPSGQNRFFIFDLKADTIISAGLVAHGSGSETETDSLVFSNTPNSGATSLGKYKIGNEYRGKFGTAFKLHGLDSSNSKAFERFVVLHSHDCVPNNQVFIYDICTSLGCPTVSTDFLPVLKSFINKSKKPVLLWIYY